MDKRLEIIESCTDIQRKYELVIDYMEEKGIEFGDAYPSFIKERYRIMKNDSSVFVKNKFFRMNLCDSDKNKLEQSTNLVFEVLYENKKKELIDSKRPWTCKIESIELFEKVVDILAGISPVNDINIPREILKITDNHEYVCPNCGSLFKKAKRCPECGQLVKSEIENG